MVWRFILVIALLVVSLIGLSQVANAQDGRLMTVYDRGTERVFLSKEATIGEALRAHGITFEEKDTIEPSEDEELVASEYRVNIYRARPVIVEDGAVRIKMVSAHQTAQQIAKDVGITVHDEDIATLRPSTDFIGDGAGLEMSIKRAVPVTLDLYGKKSKVRTQARTVGDMLKEKEITLGEIGHVVPRQSTRIKPGMSIRVWQEGIQTVTVDEKLSFGSQITYDVDRPLGYRAVKEEGLAGLKSVTYRIEVRDGVEISRDKIASLTIRKPSNQVIVIGLKNDGTGLTLSRGAQHWTDSKGISHRETYYDLPMGVVMGACGQGGFYTVRPDGAKVDRDGYILIAANYGNYPKCSIVETSLGPGKVYDTGGFALRHPHGFDLATDWTRADGI